MHQLRQIPLHTTPRLQRRTRRILRTRHIPLHRRLRIQRQRRRRGDLIRQMAQIRQAGGDGLGLHRRLGQRALGAHQLLRAAVAALAGEGVDAVALGAGLAGVLLEAGDGGDEGAAVGVGEGERGDGEEEVGEGGLHGLEDGGLGGAELEDAGLGVVGHG